MSDSVCQYCGRDCGRPGPKVMHERNCAKNPLNMVEVLGGFAFISRKDKDVKDKCPVCNNTWHDFLIIANETWVCRVCGCHFTPANIREKLFEEAISRKEKATRKEENGPERDTDSGNSGDEFPGDSLTVES